MALFQNGFSSFFTSILYTQHPIMTKWKIFAWHLLQIINKTIAFYSIVIVQLEDEPSPQTEVQSALEQVIIIFAHYCIHLSLNPDEFPSSCCQRHSHSMKLPPQSFTVEMVWTSWWALFGILQTWHLRFRPKSWSFVPSDHRFLFFIVSVLQDPFGKPQRELERTHADTCKNKLFLVFHRHAYSPVNTFIFTWMMNNECSHTSRCVNN